MKLVFGAVLKKKYYIGINPSLLLNRYFIRLLIVLLLLVVENFTFHINRSHNPLQKLELWGRRCEVYAIYHQNT